MIISNEFFENFSALVNFRAVTENFSKCTRSFGGVAKTAFYVFHRKISWKKKIEKKETFRNSSDKILAFGKKFWQVCQCSIYGSRKTFREKNLREKLRYFYGLRLNNFGAWANFFGKNVKTAFDVSKGTIWGKKSKQIITLLAWNKKNHTFNKNLSAVLSRLHFTCPGKNWEK